MNKHQESLMTIHQQRSEVAHLKKPAVKAAIEKGMAASLRSALVSVNV
jgi:hypothetical protein